MALASNLAACSADGGDDGTAHAGAAHGGGETADGGSGEGAAQSGQGAGESGGRDGGGGTPASGATSATSSSSTGGGPMAPSLERVSGNGGVVPSGWSAGDPLRVRALDEDGLPVAGASIVFEPTAGSAIHIQAVGNSVTTDASGIASVMYNAFPLQPNLAFELEEVTASFGEASVPFTITVTQVPQNAVPAPPLVQFELPRTAPDLGTVQAGAVIAGGLIVSAVMQQGPGQGQPIPSFGLRLASPDDLLQNAAVGCVGGTVIASSSGTATCDIVAPNTPGDYHFAVFVGGAVHFDGGRLQVVE